MKNVVYHISKQRILGQSSHQPQPTPPTVRLRELRRELISHPQPSPYLAAMHKSAPEGTQDGKEKDTGPGELRCM